MPKPKRTRKKKELKKYRSRRILREKKNKRVTRKKYFQRGGNNPSEILDLFEERIPKGDDPLEIYSLEIMRLTNESDRSLEKLKFVKTEKAKKEYTKIINELKLFIATRDDAIQNLKTITKELEKLDKLVEDQKIKTLIADFKLQKTEIYKNARILKYITIDFIITKVIEFHLDDVLHDRDLIFRSFCRFVCENFYWETSVYILKKLHEVRSVLKLSDSGQTLFYDINDEYYENTGREEDSTSQSKPISVIIFENHVLPGNNIETAIDIYHSLCESCGLDINVPIRFQESLFPFAYHILTKIGSTPNFDEAEAYYLCQRLVKRCSLHIDKEFFNPDSEDPILVKYSSRLLRFCLREEIENIQEIRGDLLAEERLIAEEILEKSFVKELPTKNRKGSSKKDKEVLPDCREKNIKLSDFWKVIFSRANQDINITVEVLKSIYENDPSEEIKKLIPSFLLTKKYEPYEKKMCLCGFILANVTHLLDVCNICDVFIKGGKAEQMNGMNRASGDYDVVIKEKFGDDPLSDGEIKFICMQISNILYRLFLEVTGTTIESVFYKPSKKGLYVDYVPLELDITGDVIPSCIMIYGVFDELAKKNKYKKLTENRGNLFKSLLENITDKHSIVKVLLPKPDSSEYDPRTWCLDMCDLNYGYNYYSDFHKQMYNDNSKYRALTIDEKSIMFKLNSLMADEMIKEKFYEWIVIGEPQNKVDVNYKDKIKQFFINSMFKNYNQAKNDEELKIYLQRSFDELGYTELLNEIMSLEEIQHYLNGKKSSDILSDLVDQLLEPYKLLYPNPSEAADAKEVVFSSALKSAAYRKSPI